MAAYRGFVAAIEAALAEAAAIGPAAPVPPGPATGGRTALIFAPHPDDEVIIGGLPLRLRRESGWNVVNVAVTLGSRRERRAARWAEVSAACAALGFGLVTPDMAGLEGITPAGREADPARWEAAVAGLAAIIEAARPASVFVPHAADWNQTHLGTHLAVIEAMARVAGLACFVVETEFWGAMAAPNLMVESTGDDVARLVGALSLHEGEVARNPYHLRLPAWMIDNVRRGAELVFGQGGTAPAMNFATLYRVRAWRDGWAGEAQAGRGLPAGMAAETLFGG